ASFAPNPITSGGSSTLTVSTTSSTPPGGYPVAVTGTSSSTAHTAVASLFVRTPGGSDFSIALQPSTRTLVPGSGTTSTVSAGAAPASPPALPPRVAPLPPPTTASFTPNPITSGGSSTLTVSTASSTAFGTYPLKVTGTAATSAHSATTNLVVSATSDNLV